MTGRPRGERADGRSSHPPGGRAPETVAAAQDEIARVATAGRPGLHRVQKRGAGPVQYFTMASVHQVAAKYRIDISGLTIRLGDAKVRGVCGQTRPDRTITLYSPGFRSEEDLARTLVHEKFHHDEIADGRPFPRTEEEFDEWEDRAYAREEQWWENQPVRPGPRKG